MVKVEWSVMIPSLRSLADVARPDSLSSRLRRRRFALLGRLLAGLPRPLSILDVGGTEGFWRNLGDEGADGGGVPDLGTGTSVVLLNIGAPPATSTPGVRAVGGDARAMPDFADGAFDVVFSNSVIEHVGELPDQRRMADEVRRVGRRYFLQTPARSFPVEPHFLFPGFQFLPLEAQLFLVRHRAMGWFPRTPDPEAALAILRSVRLLTEPELRGLFPTEATFLRERFLGLTKSLVVLDGFGQVALRPEDPFVRVR